MIILENGVRFKPESDGIVGLEDEGVRWIAATGLARCFMKVPG